MHGQMIAALDESVANPVMHVIPSQG